MMKGRRLGFVLDIHQNYSGRRDTGRAGLAQYSDGLWAGWLRVWGFDSWQG
jgi:hypothetical protein